MPRALTFILWHLTIALGFVFEALLGSELFYSIQRVGQIWVDVGGGGPRPFWPRPRFMPVAHSWPVYQGLFESLHIPGPTCIASGSELDGSFKCSDMCWPGNRSAATKKSCMSSGVGWISWTTTLPKSQRHPSPAAISSGPGPHLEAVQCRTGHGPLACSHARLLSCD